LLSKIDLAITGVGNLVCEIGYLGIPMLFMTKEKNEKLRAKILIKRKIGKLLSVKKKKEMWLELNKIIYDSKYRSSQIKNNLLFFRKKGLNNVLKIITNKYEKI
jgi:spore coat polysaccharide biosynthesis predicted glycosyltransferase SpsG